MGYAGDLLGTLLGGAEKPKVPRAPDLGEAQQEAIQSNLEALPAAQDLASQTSQFNIGQIQEMLRRVMPGYDQLVGQSSDNINALLRGEIPDDVSQQVQTNAAVQALAGGYAGSGFHGNLLGRDLGITSLGLMQQGENSALRWISTMDQLFAPGVMNVGSMFISPEMQYQANANEWGVKWLRNQIDAMGDPLMTAVGQMIGGIGDAAASYFVGSAATQPSGSGGGGSSSSGGGMNFMSLAGGGGSGGGYQEMMSGMMGSMF